MTFLVAVDSGSTHAVPELRPLILTIKTSSWIDPLEVIGRTASFARFSPSFSPP